MIVLIIVASILLATISIFQFKNEAKQYHQERLDRKEDAIKENINYVLSNTTYPLTPNNLSLIFKDKTIDDSVIKKIDDALIKTMQFNKAENMIVLSFSGIKDVKIESGIKLLYETIAN